MCVFLHTGVVFLLNIQFHIIFEFALDDRDLRTVNNLHTTSATDNTACTACFEQILVNQALILYGYTQACGATIKRGNVFFAAKTRQNES